MASESNAPEGPPMISNRALWEEWESGYLRSQPPDLTRGLRIVNSLYAEARALGALAQTDRPDRLAHKFRLARALNVRTAARTNRV
jgi:hypothetical protein